MRYFLLAGEASGDNLGALLITAIAARDAEAEFMFWGGDAMAEASGLSPKQHIRDLAFMGFAEVVRNLRTIRRLEAEARRHVLAFAPHSLILIDYPGFNLRLGRWALRQSARPQVEFYVSPQIWAWRTGRVHKVVKSFDRLWCMLPFEPDFYGDFGYRAATGHSIVYAGHPLPKRIDAYRASPTLTVQYASGERSIASSDTVIALLPGSRLQEVSKMLAVMVAATDSMEGQVVPVIAAAPVLTDVELQELSRKHKVGWVRSSYELLAHANLACVASGTATLETALFGVPQVVVYKGSPISVAIARRLVKLEYIALVNIIMGRAVVPELIQNDANAASIGRALSALQQPERANAQREAYSELRGLLTPYDAIEQAADAIVTTVSPTS